tara:strand:+ start:404 stop:1090 length:687 start_codon:yes stop_codon:yes gene_type:complete
MSGTRGGEQKIPRPQNWEMGSTPPWQKASQNKLTLRSIEKSLERFRPLEITRENYDRSSSVMIPLYEEGTQVHMILTRRSKMMRHHTSEISFPGGNREPEDTDEWSTAKREAYEEINLDPALPRKIGTLESFVTVGSKSFVTPVVATLEGRPELKANPNEVEKILHVPLSELLLPEVYHEEVWELRDGQQRNIHFFELIGDTVWGATGSMIKQFLTIILGIKKNEDTK